MQFFQTFPIYHVTVRDPAGLVELITFVSPSEIQIIGGLPPEVIVGKLLRPGLDLVPANFGRNRAFVEFLKAVIRISVPQIDELVIAAKHQGSGWLHIHDARAFNVAPKVAAADIIGSFAVVNGVIVGESYAPNQEVSDGPSGAEEKAGVRGRVQARALASAAHPRTDSVVT